MGDRPGSLGVPSSMDDGLSDYDRGGAGASGGAGPRPQAGTMYIRLVGAVPVVVTARILRHSGRDDTLAQRQHSLCQFTQSKATWVKVPAAMSTNAVNALLT
jgi:hypothetical protein